MEISNFFYLINTHQRIFWLYLLSSFLLALYISKKSGVKLFDKEIFLHSSAKLDYSYFFVALLIKALFITPLLVGANEVALYTLKTIRYFFEYHERVVMNQTLLVLSYTFTLFIVSDFTRFLLHYAMHRYKFLWRFHSIHHSAEVLTPITYYRVHPVEGFLFGMRYALSVWVVTGVFIYFFASSLDIFTLMGVNIFLFIYNILGSNLRHSHIPLRFGVLEHFFISPYMHQIHHSKEGVNFNFGGVLSIWDRLFQTLKIEKRKKLEFGLKQPSHTHSLYGVLIEPFYKKG